MVQQTQLRRGTTSQCDAFVAAAGEPFYDTEEKSLRIGDGATAGGIKTVRRGALAATDFWEETHFLNNVSQANGCWVAAAIDSGTIGNPTTGSRSGSHHGLVLLSSAVGSGSGYRWVSHALTFALGATAPLKTRLIVFAHNLTSAEVVRFGLHTSTTASAPTHGVWFEMTDGEIVGKTSKDASASTTSTSFTASVDTWYTLDIDIAANGASATFTIMDDAGTVLWTDSLSATIPQDADEACASAIVATSTAGSATSIVTIDYIGVGTLAGFQRVRG